MSTPWRVVIQVVDAAKTLCTTLASTALDSGLELSNACVHLDVNAQRCLLRLCKCVELHGPSVAQERHWVTRISGALRGLLAHPFFEDSKFGVPQLHEDLCNSWTVDKEQAAQWEDTLAGALPRCAMYRDTTFVDWTAMCAAAVSCTSVLDGCLMFLHIASFHAQTHQERRQLLPLQDC